ncbi:MAG: sodium-dependent transporter [Gemmatimonadetes bacterium]|nr:sodium-dependent transporter [Gemmatimonadota bacterium]
MTERVAHFSSRWAMLAAMLGMAVGTGNIWRFPRVAASNGGGSFLVAWVIFLLLWSVPLILVEFAAGKATRYGPVGTFAKLMGRRFAWMGAWVAWTSIAIMFYYAVVTGWTLRYLWAALAGELPGPTPGALWERFAFSPSAAFWQAIALGVGVLVVARGVRGIEAAARIMIPTLFLLVLVLAIRAVTLPGAERGLSFLFTPSWEGLSNYRVWLEALTQNAWDTGAGWGLILTYAIYLRQREDTALNAFVLGFGNNSVSLLAGIMVLCTVFSLMPDAANQIVGAGNTGLTFVWVPELFARMPGGRVFMVLFFLALFFAAWTSLISMVELATRVLEDGGVRRGKAIALVGTIGFLLGLPSAVDTRWTDGEQIFLNQDFVWGVALMVSGLFFALAVLRYGVRRFRETLVNTRDSDIRIGRWWEWVIGLAVVQALVLVVWWFWQVRAQPLLGTYGVGSVLIQWGIALALFLALNGWMVRKTHPEVVRETAPAGEMPPAIP